MPTIVVSDGGTYSTLDAGIGAAADGDTISIEGTWDNDDTQPVTLDVANITISCDADSKHPGYLIEESRTGSTTHYRLTHSQTSGTGEAIDVNASGCTIGDLTIVSTSTDTSDEGIDYQGASVSVDSCIIHSTTTTTQKDGLYCALAGRILTITNSIVTGWGRGGIHVQMYAAASGTYEVNVDSCTIFNCGTDAGGTVDTDGGGIKYRHNDAGGASSAVTVVNTIAVENDSGSGSRDYYGNDSGIVWTINDSIDSDNSITGVIDSGTGNLASRTATDSDTPGTGDWVVFEDVTTAPYDLRLKTNAENDAEDSGATVLDVDIVGTARPQDTDDRGAFEISVGSAVSMATIQHYRHFIGGM